MKTLFIIAIALFQAVLIIPQGHDAVVSRYGGGLIMVQPINPQPIAPPTGRSTTVFDLERNTFQIVTPLDTRGQFYHVYDSGRND